MLIWENHNWAAIYYSYWNLDLGFCISVWKNSDESVYRPVMIAVMIALLWTSKGLSSSIHCVLVFLSWWLLHDRKIQALNIFYMWSLLWSVIAYIEFSFPRYPVLQFSMMFLRTSGNNMFYIDVLLFAMGFQMRNTLPSCWMLRFFWGLWFTCIGRSDDFLLHCVFVFLLGKPVMIRFNGCWTFNVEKHLTWLGRSEAFNEPYVLFVFVLFLKSFEYR